MLTKNTAGSATIRQLALTVNGKPYQFEVDLRESLLDVLRNRLQFTGVKQGCSVGECGACTVLVDGKPQLSCITLACRCEGQEVQTIESLANNGRLSALQSAFNDKLGSQCGFCTPGMVMAAQALLLREPDPTEEQIREALSGNICRCTGYVKIIESVQAASAALAAPN